MAAIALPLEDYRSQGRSAPLGSAASVWSSVPSDAALIKIFQDYFAETILHVVAVFKAMKVTDSFRLGKDGAMTMRENALQNTDNLRVLVLTVKTVPNSPRLQPILNKFTLAGDRVGGVSVQMQGRPWPLKLLTRVGRLPVRSAQGGPEAVVTLVWGNPPTAGAAGAEAARLAALDAALAADSKVNYALPDSAAATALVAMLFLACVVFDGHEPELNGIEAAGVDEWRKELTEGPGLPSIVRDGEARRMFDERAVAAADGQRDFKYLTARDQAQLSSLLQMFASAGDLQVSALQESLNAEYAALEAANVHAILNSSFYIPQVLRKINVAFSNLEDLEVSLDVFDGKLAVMREDIAAIEARNNALKLQTRNLGALQAAMTELLATLTLERKVHSLANCTFTESRLEGLVEAAWQLQEQLDVLTGRSAGLKPEAQAMRSVVEFRSELQGLALRFLDGVKRFLNKRFTEMPPLDAEKGFPAQPATLQYAPLLRVTGHLPGGGAIVANVTENFVSVMAAHMRQCVRSRVAQTQSLKFAPLAEGADSSGRNADRGRSDTPSKGSFVAGSAVTVHGAIIQVLQDLLPLLAHATNYTCDLLMLRAADDGGGGPKAATPPQRLQELLQPAAPLSSAGRSHAANMLAALPGDVIRLLDLVPKRATLPLAAVAAVCRAWRSHLAPFPALRALSALLDDLTSRCEAGVDAQSTQVAKEIEKFDASRSAAMQIRLDKNSVVNIHVLPFVDDVAARAGGVCSMLREGVPSLQWPLPWGDQVLVANGSKVLLNASDLLLSYMNRVLRAVFDSLKRLSAADAKHGARLLLENFAVLEPALKSLKAALPELEVWAKQVSTELEAALGTYVEQQLQYSRFWVLLELGDRLAALLRDVSPAEVPFQVGFSQQAVQLSLSEALDGADKKIVAMGQRVRKHLGDNTQLLRRIWKAINASMLGRVLTLERHLQQCYPDVRLPYSAAQIQELLKLAEP